MAIDKSTWNKKIKVSQSTIDDIKRLGMTKALKLAKTNAGASQAGLVKEYQEATRRLYGDRRFAAATGTSAKAAPKAAPKKMTGQPSGYRNPKQAGPMKGQPSGYSNPKQAGPSAGQPSGYRNPKPTASVKKADNSKSNLIKGVAGTAAAVGLLVAGRGKGAGLISKLSPQVGRAMNSPVGRVLTGTVEKSKASAASTSGRIAAKTKKTVSQSQYDAMMEGARLRGTKSIASKVTKKTAAAPKKSGLSAGKRWDANAPKSKAKKPKK